MPDDQSGRAVVNSLMGIRVGIKGTLVDLGFLHYLLFIDNCLFWLANYS